MTASYSEDEERHRDWGRDQRDEMRLDGDEDGRDRSGSVQTRPSQVKSMADVVIRCLLISVCSAALYLIISF